MFERANSNRLYFRYKQSQNGKEGENEEMQVTFSRRNILKPILNINGSIFEGKVVAVTSHSGNKRRSFLKIEFNDDKLPRGIKNRNVSFDLAEYLSLPVGFLGLSFPLVRPILRSEHLSIKINHIAPINKPSDKSREKILSVENTQVKTQIIKEKKFKTREKMLIRELIAQIEKVKSTKSK